MTDQEKLLQEIKTLSDSIRIKNRALRLGISERDKYLEQTFKPIIEPLKEVSQGLSIIKPKTEGEAVLPTPKKKKKKKKKKEEEESYLKQQIQLESLMYQMNLKM